MENQGENKKKQERKERRANEPRHVKIIWNCIYTLCAALMVTGIYMIVRQSVIIPDTPYEAPPALTGTPTPAPTATPVETDAPTPTATPEPTPTPDADSPPLTISFPKAELTSEVVPVGLDGVNIGTVDSATLSAWYRDGAAPGDAGNCIINGHVTFRGQKGVFSYLRDMTVGEEVVVKREDGNYLYYKVALIEEHPFDDFPQAFLRTDGETRLTLITCKGDFSDEAGTSLTRVVVVCEQVGMVNG